MNILITGAGGFIGSALCSRLASGNKVIGLYHKKKPVSPASIAWEQANLTDLNAVASICEKYSPDVLIHCAGIAHQKIGAVDFAAYMRTNSEATENLAKVAAKINPEVHFVFLSSVSVYGEDPQIPQIARIEQEKKNNNAVNEDSECRPSSDYAFSKLDAEKRLIALSDEGIIHDLTILRPAPVYDREWSFNLDRRVLAPLNMAYIRFGSGLQKMSALARPNLVDFITYLIENKLATDTHGHMGRKSRKGKNTEVNVFNVCDPDPYEFNTIIRVFKRSGIRPNRLVISVPLPVIWFATHIAGVFFSNKREWIYSCYDKLASDLFFDNGKMLKTGFRPRHCLETIFS